MVVYDELRKSSVKPITSALVTTPTSSAICCRRGVEPTRKPVLRSWLVVPPLEAAMQTIAAVVSAIERYCTPTHPMARKRRHVRRSVATVIPEMGFDDD